MSFTVNRIDHLVLNVADLKASAEWYGRVLGMRREIADGRTIMWFGKQKLHLRPVDAGQAEWFTGRQPAPGSDDLCFATVERAGARGAMTSVYCRDPDGSLIEISTYRPAEPAYGRSAGARHGPCPWSPTGAG